VEKKRFKNGEKGEGFKDIFVFVVRIHLLLKKENSLESKQNIPKGNKLRSK